MIDTIKIVTMVNKTVYQEISKNSIIKTSYHSNSGEIYYKIVNDRLEGSYSSSLSVRVGEGAKYKFINMYYLEIEGSFHKIVKGYNSHNGFYNLISISKRLIDIVSYTYNVELPDLKHWFLQRIDIAVCYDLKENRNVREYINNLSLCNYPRRNLKFYQDESIYMTGATTTLKIYNKLLEFKKHDIKKLRNTKFDIGKYLKTINGFIRFECEIKKKKLVDIYKSNYIRILEVNYKDLKEIWKVEFMKLIKMFENDLKIISDKKDIEKRLYTMYGARKASVLYNFYISIVVDGLREVKNRTSKSTYYRNIKELKNANIDFSQKYNISNNIVNFNPFTEKEVL